MHVQDEDASQDEGCTHLPNPTLTMFLNNQTEKIRQMVADI